MIVQVMQIIIMKRAVEAPIKCVFFFSSDSLDNDSMVMKDKKWRKDVDDDHGKEW